MTQLAIMGWLAPHLPDDLREAYELAAEHVLQPNSPNTRRAYTAAWRAWSKHCARPELLITPLPVDPVHLVAYLQSLTQKLLAPNSVRLHLAALCALDQEHALLTHDTERGRLRACFEVQRWLRSWSRLNPHAPRKRAPALTTAELVATLRVAQEPRKNASRVAHAALYARDRCLLVLGCAGGFRINELCALELGDLEPSPAGLRIHLRRAKNDQAGHGHSRVLLPQAGKLQCPVDAFVTWSRIRGTVPGPLFCPIARTGLLELGDRVDEQAGMRAIVARCKAAGLERVTSHSLRATFYTLTKKKPLSDVMKHVNSKSAAIALEYQRQGNLYDPEHNVTSGLLDD